MFKIIKKSLKSQARLGKLKTNHGWIKTPLFMPVATYGAVKNLEALELKKLNYEIILLNAFHLFLRPGTKIIKKIKGIHSFINWKGAILTDSGGFQVFSLARARKVSDRGVLFNSPIDGQKIFFTPEKAIEVQIELGVDILMVLDECLGYPHSYQDAKKAQERTTFWAQRSKEYFNKKIKNNQKPLLFGIIQGGVYSDLREKSLKEILEIGFDGYALGGFFVGEPKEKSFNLIAKISSLMPEMFPRYLMGAAYPYQLVEGVKRGIDMFDCVIPTREARHGKIYKFIKEPKSVNINKKNFYRTILIEKNQFKNKTEPIDKQCLCFTCRNYSLAYLHHLFKIKEGLALRLLTIHNLAFYSQLIQKIREAILKGEI